MNNISNTQTQKSREPGLDIIRALASLFVVSAHFYLNIGYYNTPLVGAKMFIMTACRWLFMTSIPMFFMLTGYFKLNKTLSKSHYKSLIPLLFSYLVISVIKMLIYNKLYGKIYPLKEILKNLGNYEIAWYMGMYILIILLIPFLNKLWKALDKKEQTVLLVTLVFVCAVYPVFHYIAPSFFVGLYPVMYYYFGVYIKENKPSFNKCLLGAAVIVFTLTEAVISVKLTPSMTFDWTIISTADGGFGSILLAIPAVSIFLFFYQVNINSSLLCKLFSAISKVSFEIYLIAGIFDAVIYTYLKKSIFTAPDFFFYFFITVPISFIGAFLIATVFTRLRDLLLGKIYHLIGH